MTDCPHPSVIIHEELVARGWPLNELARRMGGEWGINLLMLELYFACGEGNPNLRLGEDMAKGLSAAFDVSEDYFLALEKAWLASKYS